jgi:hypothetical protein
MRICSEEKIRLRDTGQRVNLSVLHVFRSFDRFAADPTNASPSSPLVVPSAPRTDRSQRCPFVDPIRRCRPTIGIP